MSKYITKLKLVLLVWVCCLFVSEVFAEVKTLKIGVFNLYNPAIREMSDTERNQTFQRWSIKLFAHADIVIISELGAPGILWKDDYLKKMSESSGLPHRFAGFTLDPTWADVALLSRYPIQNPRAEDLPGEGGRRLVDAMISYGGLDHYIVGAHFTAEGPGPHDPEPNRIISARRVVELIKNKTATIVAGDLNTCPPSPEGCRNNIHSHGYEYSILIDAGLRDTMNELVGAEYCSDKRIDYIFARGPYRVRNYETCAFNEDAKPSDHPYILVTLEFDSIEQESLACPSGKRCCGAVINNVCDGQCQLENQYCN